MKIQSTILHHSIGIIWAWLVLGHLKKSRICDTISKLINLRISHSVTGDCSVYYLPCKYNLSPTISLQNKERNIFRWCWLVTAISILLTLLCPICDVRPGSPTTSLDRATQVDLQDHGEPPGNGTAFPLHDMAPQGSRVHPVPLSRPGSATDPRPAVHQLSHRKSLPVDIIISPATVEERSDVVVVVACASWMLS